MGCKSSGDVGKRKAKDKMGRACVEGDEKREDLTGGDWADEGQGSNTDFADENWHLEGWQQIRRRRTTV